MSIHALLFSFWSPPWFQSKTVYKNLASGSSFPRLIHFNAAWKYLPQCPRDIASTLVLKGRQASVALRLLFGLCLRKGGKREWMRSEKTLAAWTCCFHQGGWGWGGGKRFGSGSAPCPQAAWAPEPALEVHFVHGARGPRANLAVCWCCWCCCSFPSFNHIFFFSLMQSWRSQENSYQERRKGK